MTDIASEDGDGATREQTRTNASQRRSFRATESRPGTARTGMSSSRGAWSQTTPMRKGLQRGSSLSGSINSGRPASSTSRSHVPLASHAFFHPMSSQKLQAQRGASRPTTGVQRRSSIEDVPDEDQSHVAPQGTTASRPVARLVRHMTDDGDLPPPPSRGTEVTEPYDRITATTSPTRGHYPAGSLTESVRPLQRKKAEEKGLTLDVGKTKAYGVGGNLPSPIKSPRSFRSNLFLPGKSESTTAPANRNTHGAEKLSSGASSPQFTPATTDAPPSRTKAIKEKTLGHGYNHEYFEGNTVFCIGGRLQNTRHRPINIATGFLVVLPAILFFAFSAPYLWHHVSPAVPVFFAYFFYICISSFLHASGSDPGILPRNLHQFPPMDEHEDPLRLAPPTNAWTLIKSAESTTAAMEVPTKYCKTCNLWRPPRAHHCRLCDNCIETQDHHCVWINNCVGRRNYRYFFTFLTTATILSVYLIAASLAQVLVFSNEEHVSFGVAVSHFRVPFAMVIYGILGFIYPAALMGYHLFLMARGETTREFLNSQKFLKKDRYRAFTQGSMWKNWVVVLCRPRPPTYYRFKHRFEEGDQRFGERRSRQKGNALGGDGQDMEMQNVGVSTTGFQGPTALRNLTAGTR
ncbi:zf-DHHC-domain-containing protein [Hypoxylon trugodes]|uniref:zf-DHHC-domain-containing protein n=1 Tax=Hypoxylon trugodes TaxID=326681 RepID=UPI00219BDC07|nr:zf-DHHC-domain-containing protein [Hypoxylon trugodes]KAI1392220.1 zf-DHHC-domain-containing protein [Hypoxylon trugodes]